MVFHHQQCGLDLSFGNHSIREATWKRFYTWWWLKSRISVQCWYLSACEKRELSLFVLIEGDKFIWTGTEMLNLQQNKCEAKNIKFGIYLILLYFIFIYKWYLKVPLKTPKWADSILCQLHYLQRNCWVQRFLFCFFTLNFLLQQLSSSASVFHPVFPALSWSECLL